MSRSAFIRIITVVSIVACSTARSQNEEAEASRRSIDLTAPLETGEASISFLGHCGFAVKTNRHFLIFDYAERFLRGSDRRSGDQSLSTGYINPDEIKDLKVLVFATHEHTDHFDPSILEWESLVPDIEYFLGWQLSGDGRYHSLVGPRAVWKDGDVEVYTINSNHSGVLEVAYLVKVDGLVIYHNGDYQGSYQDDLRYLETVADNIDIAFTSCVWQEEWKYYRVSSELISLFQPKSVFPMHVRTGDEEAYFNNFQKTFQPKMTEGDVVTTNNMRGISYLYRNGRIIENSN